MAGLIWAFCLLLSAVTAISEAGVNFIVQSYLTLFIKEFIMILARC